MENYSPFTGAGLEKIWDNTVREKYAALHPDTGQVQGWEVLSKPSCTVRKILPGGHGCCSRICAELWSFCPHFLCFVFSICQYSALVEEFWLYSAEHPAPQAFYNTCFLIILMFLLCSCSYNSASWFLFKCLRVFFNMPNPNSIAVLLVQHGGRERGNFS